MNSIEDRLDTLESMVDEQQAQIEAHEETIAAQQKTIKAQRERLDAVANDAGGSTLPMSRRGALAAGGALGLLGLGAGTASAQGSGQIGTSDTPVDTIYAETLNGGLTSNEELTDLVGFGLEIYERDLRVNWSDANGLDNLGRPTRVRNFGGIRLVTGGSFSSTGNIIAGNSENIIAEETDGGTISGGGAEDGFENSIGDDSDYSTISGGIGNQITDDNSNATIGGGFNNTVSGPRSTIGGGGGNTVSGPRSTIGGGVGNTVDDASYATISGGGGGEGTSNTVSADYATVGGGQQNRASGSHATVAGGGGGGDSGNVAEGLGSVVPGGSGNQAKGDYSFAVGRNAIVRQEDDGAFVVGDSSDTEIESQKQDEARFQMNVVANAFELVDLQGEPTLEEGEGMLYISDGTDGNNEGDLVYGYNDDDAGETNTKTVVIANKPT